MDHNLYMRHMDIFFLLFFIFFLSYFFQKYITTPHNIDNHMTDFLHHHSIMYVPIPIYSPICYTLSYYL